MKNAFDVALAIISAIVWVLATIGGTGYLFYFKQPLFACAVLGLGAIAAPEVWKMIKEHLLN